MSSGRVDVHHHFVPPFYRDAVISAGGDPSGWEIPQWSEELDAEFAKKNNVSTTLLSITAPGACILKGAAAAKLARQANEYAAKLRDKDPGKYGFLANLPSLTDKELTLTEFKYAVDELKADGVTLFTRYGEGNNYLGHPDFRYLWEEISKRGTVVFVHPTHPVDTNLVNPLLPQPVIDYPFETTRTAVDLIVSKRVREFPNLKIILPHAGGTLPYLLGRPASVMPYLSQEQKTDEIFEDARNFYYDTAVSGSENVLTVLEKWAKPGHVLYGSDYPYAGPGIIKFHNEGLENYPFKDKNFSTVINNKAALELWPRLAQYYK